MQAYVCTYIPSIMTTSVIYIISSHMHVTYIPSVGRNQVRKCRLGWLQ